MKKSFSLFLTAMFLSTAASMNSLAADSNDVSSHADLSNIQNDLSVLSDSFRPIGSLGEQNAVQHLEKRFSDMGYTVTLQPYTNDQGLTGMNVIAVKEAADPNADIFILSAHHDSVPTAYGANDNASGVAALLAAAENLKDMPSDTEIPFISFTDEENGKNGSRFYTSSLSSEEKERMIGAVQFDMLGGLGTSGSSVCTADGESNWVSDFLQEKNSNLPLKAETASDHVSFQLNGIPSVLLTQNGRGYLYHSVADTSDQLDLNEISKAVETVVSVAEELMAEETPSYQTTAREQGNNYTYRQTRQNVIYFNSSLSTTEAYIGASGEHADHWEQSGNGWTDSYDTYLYSMTWFDADFPMNTYYEYRNGFLESIKIRPEETGHTYEEIYALIEAMYGAPVSEKEDSIGWADPIYSKYITLSSDDKGCFVSVGGYSVGLSNVLSSYPVEHGETQISDPEDAKIWDVLCSILPLESRQKITQFNLFTDGHSNILAYTSPIRENDIADNTRFSINIDYYDVYDENGAPHDWSKLINTIIHEYGHVLLEDETQIDLSVGTDTHDPAGFIEGSFRKNFYDTFWSDIETTGVNDYELHPTNYVSRYGANYFHEDIAETFAIFVLGDFPEGDTIAEDKIRFFWDDPEMVNLRAAIRENISLNH